MRRGEFWSEVFSLQGTVTPFVQTRVFVFTIYSVFVWLLTSMVGISTGFEVVAPYEIIGAVLALLLVIRTNAGYDRWYEGRKIWGGIVNQSRNLAQIGLAYGPDDPVWRRQFVGWVASFSHMSRRGLRDQRDVSDIRHLIGDKAADQVAASQHMPMYVAMRIAQMLRDALDQGKIDRFAFLQAEHERAQLIDHIGACERIKKTPLAKVFSIKIRKFLFLYLMTLPFAIADKTGISTPLIELIVAYTLLALDQIGVELQNPFCATRLGHLPLGSICTTIEENLLALVPEEVDAEPVRRPAELVA